MKWYKPSLSDPRKVGDYKGTRKLDQVQSIFEKSSVNVYSYLSVIHSSMIPSIRAETTLVSVQAVGPKGTGNLLDILSPQLQCGMGKTK